MGNTMNGSSASFQSDVYDEKVHQDRNRSDTASMSIETQEFHDVDSQPDDFGWYEDFDTTSAIGDSFRGEDTLKALMLPSPASEPPMYILESSLETQQLWYMTAGQRPQQPTHEREAIEKAWKNNFEASTINYPHNDLASSNESICSSCSDSRKKILRRGHSKLSNSVSMSFSNEAVAYITIHMPSFRIVRDESGHTYAEYLIMITLGGRGAVTFGIWKRHSDFELLAHSFQDIVERTQQPNTFRNTLLSWECVRRHKKWFRSLDAEYLGLKCYLIERFMQDLLYETHSCKIICNFLGIQ